MKKVYNFSAGPSKLPEEVLKEAKENLVDYQGNGFSVMEISHRGAVFDSIYKETIALIRQIYEIPDNFEVLFMQGGASLQFALVPLNLYCGGVGEYVDTGVWSSKAIKEAAIQGINHKVVASSAEFGYRFIPDINFSDDADFAYITSNNTIYGTEYKSFPSTKAPLIVDASSDIFSYKIDWNKVSLLFAGAQKNAGPSGLTIVVIKKDLLNLVKPNVPTMLRYDTYAQNESMFNTPPTFGIYMLNLVCKWILKQGGVENIRLINEKKANLLYDLFENSDGFYRAYAQENSRSNMNVVFNIKDKDEKLEKELVKFAEENDMIGLKGHRHIGGLRASIYNAVTLSEVEALANLLQEFRMKH